MAAWVCGLSPNGIVGSNPAGGMDVCLLCVVCCQVEVSATGPSLVQWSPTKCGVSECDRGTSTMSRRIPTTVVEPLKLKILYINIMYFSPRFSKFAFPVNGSKFSCLEILFTFCLYCPIIDVSVLQHVVGCLGICLGSMKHYTAPVSKTLFSKSHIRDEGRYEYRTFISRRLGGPLRPTEMSD
jgi:hypothetical protein